MTASFQYHGVRIRTDGKGIALTDLANWIGRERGYKNGDGFPFTDYLRALNEEQAKEVYMVGGLMFITPLGLNHIIEIRSQRGAYRAITAMIQQFVNDLWLYLRPSTPYPDDVNESASQPVMEEVNWVELLDRADQLIQQLNETVTTQSLHIQHLEAQLAEAQKPMARMDELRDRYGWLK